jgi:hyaluronoglucosaminidase
MMKKLLSVIFMLVLFSSTTFAASIPLRGVVEGFYGKEWTAEERADVLRFCHSNNLNAYIYAPKNDPYHRMEWRKPYPTRKLVKLRNLVAVAQKNNVRFIFAVSPGLDLNYHGAKGEKDFGLLMSKLDTMYQIGVRDFAIFFDDLKDRNNRHHENGKVQAGFLNRVHKELCGRYKDVASLLTVPTEYNRFDMLGDSGKATEYTKDFAGTLNKEIIVLYTGDGVVCDGISEENYQAANKIYGRKLGIWWNYPVNDYIVTPDSKRKGKRNAKLALGTIEKLPASNASAIFFNPMSQYNMSKIALATGAIYADDPAAYDASQAWDKVLKEQFGVLAPAMKTFAEHSRHMENSWAKCGAEDAPEFADAVDSVMKSARLNQSVTGVAELSRQIDGMEKAAGILLENLPPRYLAECKPQLKQFRRIAQADRLALKSLQDKKLDPQLKILREKIYKNVPKAVLSEKAALKFIDHTIDLLGTNRKERSYTYNSA